jgi:hypothetical protein
MANGSIRHARVGIYKENPLETGDGTRIGQCHPLDPRVRPGFGSGIRGLLKQESQLWSSGISPSAKEHQSCRRCLPQCSFLITPASCHSMACCGCVLLGKMALMRRVRWFNLASYDFALEATRVIIQYLPENPHARKWKTPPQRLRLCVI